MADVRTGPDAIRFRKNNIDIVALNTIGVPPGILATFVGGLNGPGTGMWRLGTGGNTLQWRAPGSSQFGDAVTISTAGYFVALDGADANKHVQLQVLDAFRPTVGQSQSMLLTEPYTPEAAGGDYQPGGTNPLDFTIEVFNYHASLPLTDVRVWLDPSVADFAISADGSAYSSPTAEPGLLLAATIGANTPAQLYVRRTLTAFTANPRRSVIYHFRFTLDGTNYYVSLRGAYRVFEAAAYRFYKQVDQPPLETDTPFETSPTLPYTTTFVFPNGTHYVAVSRFNGVIDSGFLPLGPNGETAVRVVIAGGQEALPPPAEPNEVQMCQGPDGTVCLRGFILLDELPAAERPTQWAIGITTDGTNPPAGAPTYTVPMPDPLRGLAVLQWTYPLNISQGVTIKIVVQTRRNDGDDVTPNWVYSGDSYRFELTIDLTGPTAPAAQQVWPRPLGEGVTWV